MSCAKEGHAGGPNCSTCRDHAFLKSLGEQRKARGIRLKQFCIRCDSAAVVSLSDFWSGWVQELGKEKATDYLVICMRRGDEALRQAIAERSKKRA